jgi:uncharacterized DUF497 family protein
VDFAWDQDKKTKNEKKHGISFSEASTVFADPLELTISDPEHSAGEYRFLSIGRSNLGNLLVVSYTERHPNQIRIISARKASRQEQSTMSNITESDEMQSEYDFSGGVRGKHHHAYQQGTNVVLLEPDIAKVFKDSEAVNHALRMLIDLAGDELIRNLTKDSS